MKIRVESLRVLMLLLIVSCLLGCGGDSQSNENRKETSPPPPSFNVSGTITAAGRFVTDSDVNDPAADYIPNDTFAQAQKLPNPVVVGGYVNFLQTGPQGRSFANGDPSDFFSVDLAAGQVITLYISEATGAQFDLALYDANQALIDASLGPAAVESVTAPADGTYFAEVRAVRLHVQPDHRAACTGCSEKRSAAERRVCAGGGHRSLPCTAARLRPGPECRRHRHEDQGRGSRT